MAVLQKDDVIPPLVGSKPDGFLQLPHRLNPVIGPVRRNHSHVRMVAFVYLAAGEASAASILRGRFSRAGLKAIESFGQIQGGQAFPGSLRSVKEIGVRNPA
jgi:hypothetical protein